MNRALLTLVFMMIFHGCVKSSGPHREVGKKEVAEPKVTGDVVIYNQVREIFNAQCSRCHPGVAAPDWSDYKQALVRVQNGKLKERLLVKQDMPPVASPEASGITAEDRALVEKWIQGGGLLEVNQPPPDTDDPVPIPKTKWNLVESCTSCHGDFGLNLMPGVPNLAELPKDYLVTELLKFQSGERKDLSSLKVMNVVAKDLSEEDIEFVANYFSRLDNIKEKQKDELSEEEKTLDKKGKNLVYMVGCNGCHMSEGNRPYPDSGMPGIANQDKDYLFIQLKAFRDEERTGGMMSDLIKYSDPAFTDEDLKALALHISRLTPSIDYEEEAPEDEEGNN